MKRQKDDDRIVYQSLAMIMQFGLNMIVPICLMSALGIWLDRKLDTSFFTIALFAVGAVAGGQNIYRIAKGMCGEAETPAAEKIRRAEEVPAAEKIGGTEKTRTEEKIGSIENTRSAEEMHGIEEICTTEEMRGKGGQGPEGERSGRDKAKAASAVSNEDNGDE